MRCRPSELETESAVALDWLLAVDDAVSRAKANREREASERG